MADGNGGHDGGYGGYGRDEGTNLDYPEAGSNPAKPNDTYVGQRPDLIPPKDDEIIPFPEEGDLPGEQPTHPPYQPD